MQNYNFSLIDAITIMAASKPLTCGKCSSVFTSLERFIEHTKRKKHQDPTPSMDPHRHIEIQLPIVEQYKAAGSGQISSVYENEYPKEKLLRCEYCRRAFLSPANLEIHRRIHTGEKPYACTVCDYRCSQSGNLTKHLQTQHKADVKTPVVLEEKAHKCNYCEKSFDRKGFLAVHERSHTGERPYKCFSCGKSFSQSSNLNSHLRTHGLPPVPNLSKFYQQIKQTAAYVSGDQSVPHLQVVPTPQAQSVGHAVVVQQPDADSAPRVVEVNESQSQSVLAQKYVVVNTPVQCARKSPQKLLHKLSPEGNGEQDKDYKPYECDLCNNTFMNKIQFDRHFQIHFKKGTPYKCPDCDFTNHKRSNVIRHYMGHSIIRPFKCGLCLMSFTTKYRLGRHMNTHIKHTPEELAQLEKIFGKGASCALPPYRGQSLQTNKTVSLIKTEVNDDDDSQDTFPYSDMPDGTTSEDGNALVITEKDQELHEQQDENSADQSVEESQGESGSATEVAEKEKTEQHHKSSIAFMKNILNEQDDVKKKPEMKKKSEVKKKQEVKRPFKCGLCERSFSEQVQLMAHIVRHSGQKPFQCSYCAKRFSCASNLRYHLPTHTGEKPFECEYCKKRFAHYSTLKSHKRIHGEKGEFECGICKKNFTQKKYLVIHLQRHAGYRPYKCDQCPKAFTTTSALSLHKQTHTVKKPFKCDQCDKSFTVNHYLTRHKQRHTENKTDHRCDKCGKSFKFYSNLYVHKRTHAGLKPFECEICTKSFSHSQAMLRHMKVHMGDMSYSCEICDKEFAQKLSLERHVLKHSGEKPFVCDHCDKVYTSELGLKQHLRYKHMEDTLIKCNRCNKSFSNRTTLDIHKRIHTGEKPYKCCFCDRSFAQGGNLNKHMKNHGSMPIPKSPVKKPRQPKKRVQTAATAPEPGYDPSSEPRVLVVQQPQVQSVLARKFVILNK